MPDEMCGVIEVINGKEWICIKKVHGASYLRKTGDRTHTKGDVIINPTRASESHYFIKRRFGGIQADPE